MVFIVFNCSHICVCEHSYFLIARAGYRSRYVIYVFLCFIFLFQLLLSFLSVQWNPPNLPSCARLLSKMMKYVFMQLISSSLTRANVKEGCLLQDYVPFLLFSSLYSLLQAFGLLLHLLCVMKELQQCLALFCF